MYVRSAIQTCTSGHQLKLLLATEDDLRHTDTLREPSKHVRQVSHPNMYVRSATKTTAGYGGRPETHRHTEGAIQTCTSGHQLKLLPATEDDLRHTDTLRGPSKHVRQVSHPNMYVRSPTKTTAGYGGRPETHRHTEGAIQTCTSGQQLKLQLATEDDLRHRDTLRGPSKHVHQVSN